MRKMEIPKILWNSPEVLKHIQAETPVVLLGCPLATPAADRWTLDYLSTIIPREFPCDVYVSESKRFQYWSDKTSGEYDFTAPTTKLSMSIQEFLILQTNKTNAGPHYYLQQAVVGEMGPAMMKEYTRFSLEAALQFKLAGQWDTFSTNLLLISPAGAVTPCHFDEQQNLFAQLAGRKRVRLFPPAAWNRLYTYPLNHPCDRQTQVVLPATPGSCVLEDEQQRAAFPAFATCSPDNSEVYTDLEPGEMLYIPQYWFHQMEALTDNTSLSWWFKHQLKHKGKDSIDASTISMIAVRRNLEKLICDSAGGPKNAHKFFLSLAAGRVPIPMTVYTQSSLINYDADNNAQHPEIRSLERTRPDSADNENSVSGNSSSSSSSSSSSRNSRANAAAPTVESLPASELPDDAPSPVSHGSELSTVVSGEGLGGSAAQENRPFIPLATPLATDVAQGEKLAIDPKWSTLAEQSVQIASLVLPAGWAPAFLQEMVAGRFSGLRLVGDKLASAQPSATIDSKDI